MSDQRLGSVIRVVRVRRGWRQLDVATKARVSQITVSRIERGHFESLSLDRLRDVAMTLDIRVDLVARYRGGDLDRLLNAGHSRLHEAVFRMFRICPSGPRSPRSPSRSTGSEGSSTSSRGIPVVAPSSSSS
jgi:transcriptional regulator with XRE-family HTH domain